VVGKTLDNALLNKEIIFSFQELSFFPGPGHLTKELFRRILGVMNQEAIRVIVTGGTFDKHYDEIRGELTFRDSHLPEILKRARVRIPVNVEQNQLIDSLQMQDENRKAVLASCIGAPERMIVITHGTDTMTITASLLGEAGLAKTIVLTGAMVPYQVQDSDALFNFGTAFSAVQLLDHGVYIVMNGKVFPWDRVRKNRAIGVFEEIGQA